MTEEETLPEITHRIQQKLQNLAQTMTMRIIQEDVREIKIILSELRLLVMWILVLWGLRRIYLFLKAVLHDTANVAANARLRQQRPTQMQVRVPHHHCKVNVVPTVTYIPFNNPAGNVEANGSQTGIQNMDVAPFQGVVTIAAPKAETSNV
ncbi:hypothetical protein CVT24_001778 [Panaeolus cyanescens]|uniref:Uncharacterized protein n=1 Tax=Panaeolus cyanescens TaxID=181874 RepID=A0A409YU88_9AGAR|nr:hypothetical protein CVT24_001778 [Panaeolus cyanescens]